MMARLSSGLRSAAVTALPLALLAAVWLLLRSGETSELAEQQTAFGPEDHGGAPAPAAFERKWETTDFTARTPEGFLSGWETRVGDFRLVTRDGKPMLEQQPEPVGEGTVIRPQILPGGGGIRARVRGDRGKRTFPRFCVGLQSTEEVFFLRAVPNKRALELVTQPQLPAGPPPADKATPKQGVDETVLASAPWRWREDAWLWLEFSAAPAPDGGTVFTGRAWAEGEPRPDKPVVKFQIAKPPGILRAALHGAPYAGRPLYCDRLETRRGGLPEK